MQTASMERSAITSRKSFTAFTWKPPFWAASTARSRCGWYTSHTATGCASGSGMAYDRLEDPMAPTQMKPMAIRSLAHFTRPVKRDVVNTVPAAVRTSRRRMGCFRSMNIDDSRLSYARLRGRGEILVRLLCDLAGGGPLDAPLERDDETDAPHGGGVVAQSGVEHAALAIADRHQHRLVLARPLVGRVGVRGGDQRQAGRRAAERIVQLILHVHPDRRQALDDRMTGVAQRDLKREARAMVAASAGIRIEPDLSAAPAHHWTELRSLAVAPATHRDHLLVGFPLRKGIVGGVIRDQAAAVADAFFQRARGGGRPGIAGVIGNHHGICRKVGLEGAHVRPLDR